MAQPDFGQLAQHLGDTSHQISLIPNLPAVHNAQTIAGQLRLITTQLITVINDVATLRLEIKTQINTLRTEINTQINTFRNDLTSRMDAR